MVIFRPTAALAKRMKIKLHDSTEHSTTLLGDWFAQPLVLNRKQYVLCTSEHGRLPVVIPAAPYNSCYTRLPDVLAEVLLEIGVSAEKVEQELLQMNETKLAKTNNRSILGSMKESRFELECQSGLNRLGQTSLQISVKQANMISLVLPDLTPLTTVRKLFGVQADSEAGR
jgi:hypothetical protein